MDKTLRTMTTLRRLFSRPPLSLSTARRPRTLRNDFASMLFVSTLCQAAISNAGTCAYEIQDEWNNGFKAKITVTNGPEAVSTWALAWTWSAGTSLNNGWNAPFDCNGNSCSITPPPWKSGLNAGETYSFGFTARKPNGSAAEVVTLGGEFCDGGSGGSIWNVDASRSSIHYVSVKKDHLAETNTFVEANSGQAALVGSLDSTGAARIELDLNAVSTGVDIRNSRLLALLFETALLPKAYFQASIDLQGVEEMAVGSTRSDAILGELSLHGARQGVAASVLIAKLSDVEFSVSTLAPIIVDSKNFDMGAGIEALRLVANLSSIGEAVPVYFDLTFRLNESGDAVALELPAAPNAPSELAGDFNANTAEASVNWRDNSDNEDYFLVRRKAVDGFWKTVAELNANSTYLAEGLPDSGEFDYKVIALNDGMPSLASNTTPRATSWSVGRLSTPINAPAVMASTERGRRTSLHSIRRAIWKH